MMNRIDTAPITDCTECRHYGEEWPACEHPEAETNDSLGFRILEREEEWPPSWCPLPPYPESVNADSVIYCECESAASFQTEYQPGGSMVVKCRKCGNVVERGSFVIADIVAMPHDPPEPKVPPPDVVMLREGQESKGMR